MYINGWPVNRGTRMCSSNTSVVAQNMLWEDFKFEVPSVTSCGTTVPSEVSYRTDDTASVTTPYTDTD